MALRHWINKLLGNPQQPPPPPAEPDLPYNVSQLADGSYEARCQSCELWYELPCDLEEFDPDFSYCGGSDRCIP